MNPNITAKLMLHAGPRKLYASIEPMHPSRLNIMNSFDSMIGSFADICARLCLFFVFFFVVLFVVFFVDFFWFFFLMTWLW